MAPQTQVKVFESGAASFGGTPLRRLTVNVGGRLQQLLLHEQSGGMPFVLSAEPVLGTSQVPLPLIAEWGEPLAEVCELHTDEQTGEVLAYALRLRCRDGSSSEMTLAAADTYWWNGELYARKRVSYGLRDLQRGKRARVRAQAA